MNKPPAKECDFPQFKRGRVEQDRRVLERRQTQRRDPQQWGSADAGEGSGGCSEVSRVMATSQYCGSVLETSCTVPCRLVAVL